MMRLSANTALRISITILLGAYLMYFWSKLKSARRSELVFSLDEVMITQNVTQLTTNAVPRERSIPPKFKTDVAEPLEARRHRLQSLCRRDEFKSARVPRNFIVDRKRKLMYCDVPKIGSTFWKSVFAILAGSFTNMTSPSRLMLNRSSEIHAIQFLRFNKLSPTEKITMATTGRFLLFIRDPYMRLLSAYMDKFVRPNKFYWHLYGTKIVTKIRHENTTVTEDRRCGHNVTLEEFINFFIIDQNQDKMFHNTDHHWTPIHQLCSPCSYPYHYIGKTEFMFDDTKNIIQSENLSGVIDLDPSTDVAPSIVKDISRRAKQFIEEWFKLSDCISLSDAVRRFWKYLSAKGYFHPKSLLPKELMNIEHLSKENLKKTISLWAVKEFREHYFSGSIDLYRRKFAEKAYSTIPSEDLNLLKDILKTDCILFGYDIEPDYVFSQTPTSFV